MLLLWWYLVPATFHVADITKRERFTLYSSGTSTKPANFDLSISGRTSAPFTIEISAASSNQPLFQRTFPAGSITFDSKPDFYNGRGIDINYLPSSTTATGEVIIKARINTAF